MCESSVTKRRTLASARCPGTPRAPGPASLKDSSHAAILRCFLGSFKTFMYLNFGFFVTLTLDKNLLAWLYGVIWGVAFVSCVV